MNEKHLETYLRIAAGNPNLFVPKDVTKMKLLTFADVAAHNTTRGNDKTRKRKRKREWTNKQL